MNADITQILQSYRDDPEELCRRLLPVVYGRIRGMAQRHMAFERRQVTLQPTVLAHEAFLRLLRGGGPWENRRHFLGAASEAMRRILVEQARRRNRIRHGGDRQQTESDPDEFEARGPDYRLLEVCRALDRLEQRHPRRALVVKLRYFLGMSIAEVATSLEMSPATVKLDWTFAKAWLQAQLTTDDLPARRNHG